MQIVHNLSKNKDFLTKDELDGLFNFLNIFLNK